MSLVDRVRARILVEFPDLPPRQLAGMLAMAQATIEQTASGELKHVRAVAAVCLTLETIETQEKR